MVDIEFGFFLKGEIFGGIDIGRDENDGEVLLQLLGECCSGSVPDVLSRIKGPWAIIYWQVIPSGKFGFSLLAFAAAFFLLGILLLNCLCTSMDRKVQKLCGLLEMHLVGGVFLFTGQHWRTFGFCCRLYHPFLQMSVLLVCIAR